MQTLSFTKIIKKNTIQYYSSQDISTTIQLTDSAPDGIDVRYTAHCSDGDSQSGVRVCSGLSLGQEVSFDLDITATSCDKSETRG